MPTGAASVPVQAPTEGAPPGVARVRLAHQPDFAVGPLRFVPSRRLVVRDDGREEVVEPRVMQVLVALFRANGAIVARDDLIEGCWEGRIVGEDAINRVISRVRRLQQMLGSGIFEVETVTRVGYRMRLLAGPVEASPVARPADEPPGAVPPPRIAPGLRRWPRRALLQAAIPLATAVGLPALVSLGNRTRWLGLAGHVPDPVARRYYDEGMRAQYHSLVATSEQAEAWFRQAAEADPDWPDAWGSLAMSYRHMLDGETNVAQWRLVEQTRSAARRALELDPRNAEALVALELVRTPFRRWQEAEAGYRALLARVPDAFILRGHLGRLLRDVGRYGAALAMFAAAMRQQPLVLPPAVYHALTLWGLGRVHQAEAAFKAIIERWPRHVAAWSAYTAFLTYSGRAGAAAVFASDREARPAGVPDRFLDRRMVEARAIATRERTDVARARSAIGQFETRALGMSPAALPVADLLPFYLATGDLDSAFARLEGFFLGRGRFASAGGGRFGPLTRRESDFLFMPWAATLRADERFGPLLRAIGLPAYWRATGTRPDMAAPVT